MEASIIIPVYNRKSDLAHVLAQLNDQECLDFEVVVVDDGSCPSVADHFSPQDYAFALRIVRHQQRCGVGRARNTGVAHANADVLIFVDSDADVPDPGWFNKHMKLREQARSMADAARATHFVFHSEVHGISKTLMGRVDTYSNWFGSCMTKPCFVRDRHVPTNNTSVHRSVFELTGPFDEELELCEDIEWCFRCLDQSVKLIYIPGAPIGHFDRNSFGDVWRHYQRIGQYAPLVRWKRPHAPFNWLFPRNRISAIALFLPLTTLLTVHIVLQWLPRSPQVLFYAPGLFLANIAYYSGLYGTVVSRSAPREP